MRSIYVWLRSFYWEWQCRRQFRKLTTLEQDVLRAAQLDPDSLKASGAFLGHPRGEDSDAA